jgi:hypothetical protein
MKAATGYAEMWDAEQECTINAAHALARLLQTHAALQAVAHDEAIRDALAASKAVAHAEAIEDATRVLRAICTDGAHDSLEEYIREAVPFVLETL